MTGVATHVALADLVLQSLRDSGQPVPADPELPFFYLGALGPLWGEFLPTHPETGVVAPDSPTTRVWQPILALLAGTPGTPGVAANLRSINTTVTRFVNAVRDQDLSTLLEIKDDVLGLRALGATLRGQLAGVTGLRLAVGLAIGGARPAPKVAPASGWQQRDVLHGSQPGGFWGRLRQKALDSGDPRLAAFALGIPVGYATALAGNPFINGVVGAAHRNHWWRHRWVSQYVDAWVWGYCRTRSRLRPQGGEVVFPPTSGGRVPLPPYRTWDSVAGAELQDRIAVGGISADAVLGAFGSGTAVPAFLPVELVTLWLDTYREQFGELPPGLDAAGLQGAYSTTWVTTWLASSADVLGVIPPDQIDEPDDCGDRPDWVAPDGSIVVGGTTIPLPAMSSPGPSIAEIASAIAAAIIAVLEFLTGNVVLGLAALAAAAALLEDGIEPDWDALRCTSGWISVYVVNVQNALRDLFSVAGLVPPYAIALAHNEPQFLLTGGTIVPPFAALSTCRSPSSTEEEYPARVWRPSVSAASNWTRYPQEPTERPPQVSYPEGSWWPRHFVDGLTFVDNGVGATPRYTSTQDNPVAAPSGPASVLDGAEWERRMAEAEAGGVPQGAFGNALDLALALIAAPATALLNWDLDGDRGIGWPTWVTRPGSPPGAVEREQT